MSRGYYFIFQLYIIYLIEWRSRHELLLQIYSIKKVVSIMPIPQKVGLLDLSLDDKIFMPTDGQWKAIVSRDYLGARKLGITFDQYMAYINDKPGFWLT